MRLIPRFSPGFRCISTDRSGPHVPVPNPDDLGRSEEVSEDDHGGGDVGIGGEDAVRGERVRGDRGCIRNEDWFAESPLSGDRRS